MPERESVGEPKVLNYSGYFDMKEVDYWIDNFLKEKGFDKQDPLYEEHQYPEGKQIQVHKEPYKNISHYVKFLIMVDITANHIKPKILTRHGKDYEVDEGELSITITPYLQMDWQGRWDGKPFFYFLARFMDKYIQWWYTKVIQKGVVEEADQLFEQLQGLLNAKVGPNDLRLN